MEFNDGNSTERSSLNHGIVIIVTSIYSVGVLVSSLILIALLWTRSYGTFLQRMFMWIVLNVLVVDLCHEASFGYQ